jgi:hypothetical protein
MNTKVGQLYNWYKGLSDSEKENLKSNIDKTLVTIKKIFKDTTITRSVVELLVNEPSNKEVAKKSIEQSIFDKEQEISKLQAEVKSLIEDLDVVILYTTDEKSGNSENSAMSSIMRYYNRKIEANKKAKENEQKLASLQKVLDTADVSDVKQAIQSVTEKATKAKSSKKAIVNEEISTTD